MKKKSKLRKIFLTITRIDPIWKIKKFFKWLKKSIEYAWFLRNDEDWDFAFIYNMLSYKLKRTRECILKNDFIEGTKRVERQIKYAEFLIEKVNGDYYSEELRAIHKNRWGKMQMNFEKVPDSPYFTSLFTYSKAKNEEENQKANSEMHKIYDYERFMHEEYKERLYKHLKTYLHRWWD